MTYRIDNPGGGDCGFYSAAIGLIYIIQEEYNLENKSKTFELWQSKGLNVSLQEILNIDLKQLHDSPHTYKKDILFQLQMSLRNISANADKKDLFNRINDEENRKSIEIKDNATKVEGPLIFRKFMEFVHYFSEKDKENSNSIKMQGEGTKVEGSQIFHKFMELVHYFSGRSEHEFDKLSHFNELAFSAEVTDLAWSTAKTLSDELTRLNEFPEEYVFSSRETIENDVVKKAFLKDVISNGKENPDSAILYGAKKIQEPGRWATHCDLKKVAVELGVNLCINGINDGEPDPDLPTLSLNIEGEAHWTTNVEKLPEPKVEPVQETDVDRPKLTEKTQLSSKEEQVIATTVSTQSEEEKVERYQQHVKALLIAASADTFFSKVQKPIENLDSEFLNKEKAAEGESNEDFATRLQEAEYRRVMK